MESEKYYDSGKYYGFLDEAEIIDKSIFLRFDCVNADFFDNKIDRENHVRNHALNTNVIIDCPILIIEFNLDLTGNENFIENIDSWYHLEINKKGIDALRYYSFLSEGEPIKLKICQVSFQKAKSLSKNFSLDGIEDSTVEQIIKVFDKSRAETVCAYNVGQGNCNALCTADSMPILYFDFGGGITQNARTYDRTIRYCFTAKPPIILSHWDFDHWASALNAANGIEAFSMKWIVPRQKFGPTHLKHALSLHSNGNLLIFPRKTNQIDIGLGLILKGQGNSRNDSGLNFVVRTQWNNDVFTTLLPGDCDYNNIFNISIFQFDGLVASHHGGHVSTYNIQPRNNIANRIVYSYGNGNTYNHPSPNAVANYNFNWNAQNRLDTPAGHVLLFPLNLPQVSQIACSGINCSLQPLQN